MTLSKRKRHPFSQYPKPIFNFIGDARKEVLREEISVIMHGNQYGSRSIVVSMRFIRGYTYVDGSFRVVFFKGIWYLVSTLKRTIYGIAASFRR